MPRNPTTGVYEALENSWNPAVAGTVIDPEEWNATQADYVAGLNGVVLAGQPQTLTDEQKEQARENTDSMGMSVTPGQHHFVVYDTATGKFIDSGATSRYADLGYGWGHFGDYSQWPDQMTGLGYENTASLAGVSQRGASGVFGASRTSSEPGGVAIGGNFWAFNDRMSPSTLRSAWALYTEARRYPNAGHTIAYELEIVEFGTSTDPDPYNQFNSTSVGLQLGSGGETFNWPGYNPDTGLYDLVSTPASLGIAFVANNSPFRTGIQFPAGALFGGDGTDTGGEANAIKLARNYMMRWYATGSLEKFTFGSKATSAGVAGGLFYTNSGLELRSLSNGFAQVRQLIVANGVNSLDLQGSVTGGVPTVGVEGSDTNITLYLRSKGTGSIIFGTSVGPNIVQMDAAASAVNYLRFTSSATGAGPIIQTLGTDTNIDIQLTPKGTGLLKSAASFTPVTSDGAALGTSALMWSDLFLASGSVINWNNGDVTLTHAADALVWSGAGAYSFKGASASDILVLGGGGVFSVPAIVANSNTAVPAGGANTVGLKATSTANLGVFFGSGAPTLSAAQGSLYLRTDGSTTATRAYINTNGTTGWTNITTAT